MKVLKRDLRAGVIVMSMQVFDDLWYLSQIIQKGDVVKTKTFRRIKDKDGSRSKGGERKPVILKVRVEKTDFRGETDSFRISGIIEDGPSDLVSVGSHHTFNVDLDTTLTVIKVRWNKSTLDRVDEAVKSSVKANVMIVVIDRGEAVIGLVGDSKVRFMDLNENVGGKYDSSKYSDKDFYQKLSEAVERIDSDNDLSAIIVAGPGFEKDNFLDYVRQKNFGFLSKTRSDDCSMGGKAGISEVLKRDSYSNIIGELASIKDMRLLDSVLEEIGRDSGLVAYGVNDVKSAVDSNAVETILVTDSYFKENRVLVDKLFNSVRKSRGKFHILNSEGDAGKQLNALSGIAANLRFKLS